MAELADATDSKSVVHWTCGFKSHSGYAHSCPADGHGKRFDSIVESGAMVRSRIERRLADVGKRLRSLRTDLAVAEQALMQVDYEADDARLRALVSETPIAQKEHEQARRQVEVLRRNRDVLKAEISKLEARQDELLDAYNDS